MVVGGGSSENVNATKCESPSDILVRAIAARPSIPIRSELVRVRTGCPVRGRGHDLRVVRVRIGPRRTHPRVVEHRLAVHRQIDGPVDALHGAQQHSARRRSRWATGDGSSTARRRCATGPWSARRARSASRSGSARWSPAPGCRAGSGGRPGPARRTDPPGTTAAAVEHGAEHAGRVRPGEAHPLDRTRRRDQAVDLAVGQERVVGDVREIARPVIHHAGALGVDGGGRVHRCERSLIVGDQVDLPILRAAVGGADVGHRIIVAESEPGRISLG